MFVRKSRENYRQIYMIYGKSKARLWRNLSTGMPPKFFRTILCIVALLYNWYFFRTAVLLKLSDIRFSYKHCNVSRVCLLVKMASKTVTRSMDHSERFWIKLRKYKYKQTDCLGVKSRTWNAFNLSPVKSRIRARFLSKRPFTKFEAKIGLFIRRGCKNRKNLPPWMPATIIIVKAVNGRKFIFRYNRGKIFAEVS